MDKNEIQFLRFDGLDEENQCVYLATDDDIRCCLSRELIEAMMQMFAGMPRLKVEGQAETPQEQ